MNNYPLKNYTKPKILIADDNPAIVQTVFKCFSEHSQAYELLGAHNGETAYLIARDEIPDLVILDWEMPVMSGIEVLDCLQRHSETQDIPVIIATGVQIEESNLEEALSRGAVDYIRKPFSRIELISRAKAALRLADLHQREKQSMQSMIDHRNRELSTIAIQVAQKNEVLGDIEQRLKPLLARNTSLRTVLTIWTWMVTGRGLNCILKKYTLLFSMACGIIARN